MKQPIRMPALSDTMESGRLLRWLKQPGDAVERGEILAEIETDKAVMELESFSSGSLIGPLAAEEQEYPVGETLGWLGDEEAAASGHEPERPAAGEHKARPEAPVPDASPTSAEPPAAAEVEPEPETEAEAETRPEADTGAESRPAEARAQARNAAATPAKPRSAQAGAMSAVREQALEGRAAESGAPDSVLLREIEAGPPYRLEPPLLLRRVVAASASRALGTPQFRISTQADLGELKDYADRRKESFTLLVARACALTVQEQPDFNAAWTPDGLARRERVDVAIAVEAEHGLLTPVVRDAAGRPFAELSADWRALKDRIAHHKMAPEAYRGGTFYVSNLGMFPGVLQFDAIVPPGATAILAVAAAGERGTVLTLTCDHRVVFGADAARFLAALVERLARPDALAA